MNHDAYSDAYIRSILRTTKSVAMVGASANEARTSYIVLKYLLARGYRVFPINPGLAGKDILGQRVYASLADLPAPVDLVDVFRNSEAAGQTVDEILALPWLPKTIWMQLSVRNDAAAERAEAKGVQVVMKTLGFRPLGAVKTHDFIVWQNKLQLTPYQPTLAVDGQKLFKRNKVFVAFSGDFHPGVEQNNAVIGVLRQAFA